MKKYTKKKCLKLIPIKGGGFWNFLKKPQEIKAPPDTKVTQETKAPLTKNEHALHDTNVMNAIKLETELYDYLKQQQPYNKTLIEAKENYENIINKFNIVQLLKQNFNNNRKKIYNNNKTLQKNINTNNINDIDNFKKIYLDQLKSLYDFELTKLSEIDFTTQSNTQKQSFISNYKSAHESILSILQSLREQKPISTYISTYIHDIITVINMKNTKLQDNLILQNTGLKQIKNIDNQLKLLEKVINFESMLKKYITPSNASNATLESLKEEYNAILKIYDELNTLKANYNFTEYNFSNYTFLNISKNQLIIFYAIQLKDLHNTLCNTRSNSNGINKSIKLKNALLRKNIKDELDNLIKQYNKIINFNDLKEHCKNICEDIQVENTTLTTPPNVSEKYTEALVDAQILLDELKIYTSSNPITISFSESSSDDLFAKIKKDYDNILEKYNKLNALIQKHNIVEIKFFIPKIIFILSYAKQLQQLYTQLCNTITKNNTNIAILHKTNKIEITDILNGLKKEAVNITEKYTDKYNKDIIEEIESIIQNLIYIKRNSVVNPNSITFRSRKTKSSRPALGLEPTTNITKKLEQNALALAAKQQKTRNNLTRLQVEKKDAAEKKEKEDKAKQNMEALAQQEEKDKKNAAENKEKEIAQLAQLALEKQKIRNRINYDNYLKDYETLEDQKKKKLNQNTTNYNENIKDIKNINSAPDYVLLIKNKYDQENCNIEIDIIGKQNVLIEQITKKINKAFPDMYKKDDNGVVFLHKNPYLYDIYKNVTEQKHVNTNTLSENTEKLKKLKEKQIQINESILNKATQVAKYGYNSRSKMLTAQLKTKKKHNKKDKKIYDNHFDKENNLIEKNTILLRQNPKYTQNLFNQIQKDKQNKEHNFEELANITDFVRYYNELDNIKKEAQTELDTKYSVAQTKLKHTFTIDILPKTSFENDNDNNDNNDNNNKKNSAERKKLKYTFDNDMLTFEYKMDTKDLEIYIINKQILLLNEINTSIKVNLPKLKQQYKYNNLDEYIEKYKNLLNTNEKTLKQLNNNKTSLQVNKQDIIKTQEQKQKQEQKQEQEQVQLPFGRITVISKKAQNEKEKAQKTTNAFKFVKNLQKTSLVAQPTKPVQPINPVKGNLVKGNLTQVNPVKPKRGFFARFFKPTSRKIQ